MVIVNDYKLASKSLERKLEKEKLSSTAGLRVLRRISNELRRVRTEESFLKDTTEEMTASILAEKKVESKSCK